MDPKQLNFYRSLLDQVADRIESPYKADAVYLRKLADDNGALSGTQCAWCAIWNEARAALAQAKEG